MLVGIYLLKVNNKSFNKKRYHSNLTDIGTLRVGVTPVSFTINFEKILHLFSAFHC